MPMVKFSTSALGALIAPQIKSFITINSSQMTEDATPDTGAELMANAIAYGIAKALASPLFSAALIAGVGTTAGALINTTLQPSVIEI